ncbi:ABC transporter substrate-binding protein [Cohnella zeiphila]|uniref:ABC transporter substrate-binding protein n=1 Tax=Cohnella zeiphila TaxID=2761120 RepID=A0A7X0SNG0_9BACL|nr:ABC transporter substrate-binding protein [Cohnella zeiphila]MBB6733141.1 ABC transporter substrate-binding protein [Cohnella zeiphila]
MKRNKMAGFILPVLLMGTILSACGADNGSNGGNASGSASPSSSAGAASPSASAAASASSSASADSGVKTYKDALNREVEVPANPQRIVALTNYGELASLGVKPAGTLDYYLDKYSADETAGVQSVGDQEADLEKVAAVNPDLIVLSSYFKPEVIESLQKIAPTIATPWGQPPLTELDTLAGLLGKEDAEKAWQDAYKAKAAEVKAKIQPNVKEGSTAVVLQFWSKAIYQHATQVFSPLFDDLGFVPTEKEKALTASAEISEEGVVDYAGDADYLFILVDGDADKQRVSELEASAWKNLPAVKNKHVYLVDSARWNDYSTAAMEWILEDVEKMLG